MFVCYLERLLSVVFIAAILLSVVFLRYLSSKPHGLLSYPGDPNFSSSCAEKIRTVFYDRLKFASFSSPPSYSDGSCSVSGNSILYVGYQGVSSLWKLSSYLKKILYAVSCLII